MRQPPARPDASAVLSAVLGRTVGLERAQSDQRHRAEIDPATVFGDVPVEHVVPGHTATTLPDSFALPPGTFFDSASIHVLASGTLAHLRALTGDDAQLDPRRLLHIGRGSAVERESIKRVGQRSAGRLAQCI